MSERTERLQRRDLRRVVGQEATALIDAHTQALNHQVLPNLNALHTGMLNLDAAVQRLERQRLLDRLNAEQHWTVLSSQHEQFLTQSFWQRLRWLLRGA